MLSDQIFELKLQYLNKISEKNQISGVKFRVGINFQNFEPPPA